MKWIKIEMIALVRFEIEFKNDPITLRITKMTKNTLQLFHDESNSLSRICYCVLHFYRKFMESRTLSLFEENK